MAVSLPAHQIQFARLAVRLRYVTPEQIKSAVSLYRRYQAAGGEVPSLPRIMVSQGVLPRAHAEILLRHVLGGDPLPSSGVGSAAASPAPAVQAVPASPASSPVAAPVGAEVGSTDFLNPVGSGKTGSLAAATDGGAEHERLLKGLGATVLRHEIKGYKILEVIGEGSMGVVYRAHQISMDRVVALKILPPERTRNQKFVEDFREEARNAGRLNHPNLIRVHEVGKSGDVHYYSMEYVEGLTLGELMDECEGGRLDPKRAMGIFLQVAAALDHGLRAGIIHREIRPDSIMVTDGDLAKLSDLGLVKDEESRFLQGENAHYVAPEQAKGGEVDTRSDIYCLGCCLFHCLTGEVPFQGGGPKEVLGRRLLAETPDPRKINPNLPDDVAALCLKMMARDPGDRFQTPAELSRAVRELSYFMPTTASEPVPAVKPRPRSRITGRARGRKTRLTGRRRRYRR